MAEQETIRQLIDGQWVAGDGGTETLLDKYRLTPIATITTPSPAQIRTMLDSAQAAFEGGAPSPYERGAILDRAAVLLEERIDIFAKAIADDTGFTAGDGATEVRRCMLTMRLAAEEARRLAGDVIPMAGAPGQDGRVAFTLRVPLGIVLAITPFNSPLNTVTHKIAPAFAGGNAVILKPSTFTPITACRLAEVLIDAGMPAGFLQVAHGGPDVAQQIMADERVRFFAFTGSTGAGRAIQAAAGLRQTQMELGSIAFTTICADGDLDAALPKVVASGYRKAGQVCTSVQMLLVHEARMAEVEARLTEMIKAVKFGDPRDKDTVSGPLISEAAAIRVEEWIEEAVAKGARRLVGGPRKGAVVPPTLLADVSPQMKVGCQEIFGPVICLIPFSTIDEAFARVNSTPYGLAAGIFTNNLQIAFRAARELRVGGVHVNETSNSRIDLMPFGGSKDSGFGREGPAYAIREMTEERVVTFIPG